MQWTIRIWNFARPLSREIDIRAFWAQLRAYFARDVLPPTRNDEESRVLSRRPGVFRRTFRRLHERAENRLRYLFFVRDGIEIGLAMAAVFDSEDGKCFIMEFCVYPEFRGGAGTACANALLGWSKTVGAKYWELNCSDEQRIRFWKRIGFVQSGLDEWGEPLMLMLGEKSPVFIANSAERLAASSDGKQLSECNRRGRNGRRAIGFACFSPFVRGEFSSFRENGNAGRRNVLGRTQFFNVCLRGHWRIRRFLHSSFRFADRESPECSFPQRANGVRKMVSRG